MARIFISHSSANNADAIALRDWLAGEGWDDVFIDLDPERGIVELAFQRFGQVATVVGTLGMALSRRSGLAVPLAVR